MPTGTTSQSLWYKRGGGNWYGPSMQIDDILNLQAALDRIESTLSGYTSTTVTFNTLPKATVAGMYVVLSPGTSSCEIRRIASLSSSTATLDQALGNSHTAGDKVLVLAHTWFSANWWAASGDGTTECSTALQSCIDNAALYEATAYVPAGEYNITTGLTLTEGATLELNGAATILVSGAAINGVSMQANTRLRGGRIKIDSSIEDSYTGAAIYVDGVNQVHFQFNELAFVENVILNSGGQSGKAIYLYAEGDTNFAYITGMMFRNINITNFEYGIHMQAVDHASNNCFINTNQFSDIWMSGQVYGVYITGSELGGDYPCNSHQFTRVHVQSTANLVQAWYIDSSHNQITDCYIWDYVASGPAVELSGNAEYNVVGIHIERNEILDAGTWNRFENTAFIEQQGRITAPDTGTFQRYHYGMNDNALAFMTLRGGSVAQSSGVAASGSFANLFDADPTNQVVWSSVSTQIVFELTFPSGISYIDGVGMSFQTNADPGGVMLECYDGSTYTTLHDSDNRHDGNDIYISTMLEQNGTTIRNKTITKLRVTIKNVSGVNASGTIRMYSLYLHASSSFGHMWLTREAPAIDSFTNAAHDHEDAAGGGQLGTNALQNNAVTVAKFQQIAANRILGRDTESTGNVEVLTLGASLGFTGAGGIQRSALTGDVTAAANSNATTIANNAVTLSKFQQVVTDRLLGRDTAGTGNIETLSVSGGVEFSGLGGIQRSALTGDVTASAGSNATTIADEAVTNAKLAHMAEETIKGRAVGAGTGDATDLTPDQARTIINESTVNSVAPWYDYPLTDETGDAEHFNDNTASAPSTWTNDSGSPQATSTNQEYGFWYIEGSSVATAWSYHKQLGVNIETLLSSGSPFLSLSWGPLLFRDGDYTADLTYYFGLYADSGGSRDTNTFIRAALNWNSSAGNWQARGERKDGTTQTNGSWFSLSQYPPVQPLYVRVVTRYEAVSGEWVRAYIGTSPLARTHTALMLDTMDDTWGNAWAGMSMTRGAGVNDYLYVGAFDTERTV